MPILPQPNEKDRAIKGIVGSEEVELDDDMPGDPKVEELADGSAVVTLDEDEEPSSPDFQANLAEIFDKTVLQSLGSELCDLVEKDKEARKRRDEQYEEGLRRTGLGNDAPGGAGFNGSSKVVHPLLAESCVDFASRAIKELFPPSGPVKTSLWGAESEERLRLASKKAKFLNWQLSKQMREYRSELEQLLTQLPMGGSQYQKFYYDERLGRSRTEFAPIDDVVLPYAATDFYTSHRVTHVQHVTAYEFKRRIKSGLYRDIPNLAAPGTPPELTATAAANERIEGKDQDAYNDDGLRDLYEIYVYHEFDEDKYTKGDSAPYIVTVDVYSEQITAIYRNWEEQDSKFEKLDWMVEWKFIPWRGAYAIGFPHLIGGLSGAATGALRALLDAAHINNSQTLIKLKGGKMSGQNIEVEPTQVAELEGPAGVDDIRKLVMAMPYNQPSEVLFKLLGFLSEAGRGVVNTAEDAIANVGDRTPVGTTMAMVEQGSQKYSAIHARLHYSQAKALEILCRLNYTFMDDEETIEELGDLVISREDFRHSKDIQPVSDPRIFSEAQRYAQMHGVIQLRQVFPNLQFNDNAIARRMLERMQIADYDEILPETPRPQNMNPAAENVAAMHGQPVIALPKQNHYAHIRAHVEFCMSPIIANPLFGGKVMGIMVRHIGEHIGFFYADLIARATRFEEQVTVMPTVQLEQAVARASAGALQTMAKVLGPLMQHIQHIAQMAQQFAPPPPMDPAVDATYRAAMSEIDRKKERDKMEIDLEREHKLALQPRIDQAKYDTDLAKNDADNRQKHVTELLKNQGDNETKQWIESMKMQNEQMMAQFQAKLDAMSNIVQQAMQAQQGERQHAQQLEQGTIQHQRDIELNDQTAAHQMLQNEQSASHQVEQGELQHERDKDMTKFTAENAPPEPKKEK